jgi:hypothetical protein
MYIAESEPESLMIFGLPHVVSNKNGGVCYFLLLSSV